MRLLQTVVPAVVALLINTETESTVTPAVAFSHLPYESNDLIEGKHFRNEDLHGDAVGGLDRDARERALAGLALAGGANASKSFLEDQEGKKKKKEKKGKKNKKDKKKKKKKGKKQKKQKKRKGKKGRDQETAADIDELELLRNVYKREKKIYLQNHNKSDFFRLKYETLNSALENATRAT
ncbi:hypothetical protein, conserved [Eimeria tenella]|uniref:Uncharacterized protein n=1 Tax=Eimeria tenella TaxID=5802 RepID=U6KVY0_EIMTE|nr:hypothetical protein, conserved [Eimeria tenella]CDJ42126.1 hypothetical protein, conserved [Eimeria tenella]|eukprot:XP_013232876.1 hypothetical protein, conserved [Eimeria tenella]